MVEYIKEVITESTAGNLSVQLDKLASVGYISVEKGMFGKRPRTACSVTPEGQKAFEEYVEVLKTYQNL